MVVMLLCGCPTAPVVHNVVRTSMVAAPAESAWDSVVDWITERNWSIKTIDKASGLVATEWADSPERYVDCGSAPMASIHSTATRVNIRVRPREGQTEIVINAQFRQLRSLGDVSKMIECNSTGVLESEIRASIGSR